MENEMTLKEYKLFIAEDLRYRCRRDREKYFPEDVMLNLLIGQTYDNSLITIENYSKLVTYYRTIVSTYEPQIMACPNKSDIDTLYASINLPDEAQIMKYINEV
jgi:hypothetical protein